MSDQPTNPNQLQAVFSRGDMSRRAFMRNAAALKWFPRNAALP